MIIFLHGQDTYRLKEKLKEIVAHYQKVHPTGLNLKVFDLSSQVFSKFGETSFQDFKDALWQISMFGEKKLFVLEGIFNNQSFKEDFLKQKEAFKKSKDIIVVCQEGKAPKNDKLFKFLKENGRCQEFTLLGGVKLRSWVKEEFNRKEAEIAPRALEKLIEFVGNNLWRMNNEVNKLIDYKKSSKKIEEKDVELLVKPKLETEIFETITAVAKKNKKKALYLIEKHLEKGDNPIYLLSMINYQFRNLLLVKTQGSYRSGLHSFAAKKAQELARDFSLTDLKKIYQTIFEADLDIKTGRISPQERIKMLISEI